MINFIKIRHLFANYSLQQLQLDHAQALFDLTDQNRLYLAEFLPWVPHVKQLQDTLNFINNAIQEMQNSKSLTMVICDDNTIIGTVGFVGIYLMSSEGEIGYWISQEYQGKGIVSAACKCIIDIGFREIGLNKIFIRCLKDNLKSQAVAIRLGFEKLEGRLDSQLIKQQNHCLVFCLQRKS